MEITLDQARKVISEHEEKNREELYASLLNLSQYINKLIEITPTGEQRNIYTDINILFELVKSNINL